MGFKWVFYIVLDQSCSDKMGQPKDIYGSLEGANSWQERQANSIYLWWFVRYHTINLKPEDLGHFFICWSSKTTSLPFLCPLNEIQALSFVVWNTLGDRRHHRGSCREPCLSARPLLPPLTACGMLTKMNGALSNCLVSTGHETRNCQNALHRNSEGADFCFLSFLPPVLGLGWSRILCC